MEEQTKADKLIKDLKDYFSDLYELSLLKTTDKLSIIASRLIVSRITIFFVVLSICFYSFSAAFYLSGAVEWGGGFLIVGSVYFLLFIIFRFMLSSYLKTYVQNKVIYEVMKNIKS